MAVDPQAKQNQLLALSPLEHFCISHFFLSRFRFPFHAKLCSILNLYDKFTIYFRINPLSKGARQNGKIKNKFILKNIK